MTDDDVKRLRELRDQFEGSDDAFVMMLATDHPDLFQRLFVEIADELKGGHS